MTQPKATDTNLYEEAVTEGITHYREHVGTGVGIEIRLTYSPRTPWLAGEPHVRPTLPVLGPTGPGFWIARYAARKATDALLDTAKEIGVTPEQWEALRAVAAKVAYD